MSMFSSTLLIVCMMAMTLLPCVSASADIDLARLQGWSIVVAPDAIPSEKYAAEEFQRLYEQASGIKLPIVNEPQQTTQNIFIGSSSALASSSINIDTKAMGDEAFRIRASSDQIAIAGGRPRGTLYGVYTFLEDYLGIRFLTPDHTHVPAIQGSQPLPEVDRSYDPPIVFRWSYWYDTNKNPDFAARIRSNGVASNRPELGGVSPYKLINHSLHVYVNSKTYGQEHPEYFALIDGERRANLNSPNPYADAHGNGTQLCMSNPGLIKLLTEKVLEELRARPHTRLIQLGQGDNLYYCRCETCAAIDEREGTHMGALLTGINQIAEAVEKEFPNVVIGTLAYKYSRKPPRTFHARPNVQIQLCSIECSVTKPLTDTTSKRNQEFVQELKDWRERASRISVWTYNTNFWEFKLPGPLPQVVGPNIKLYHEYGVTQFFVQGNTSSPDGAFADLMNYVTCRLLWNPSLDSDAVIEEFLTLHYGPAAAPIRTYLQQLQDRVNKGNFDQHCYGRAADFGVTGPMLQRGWEAARAAEKLADTPELKQRVSLFKLWVLRSMIEDAWVMVDPRHKGHRRQNESLGDWLTRLGMPRGCIDQATRKRTRPFIRQMLEITAQQPVAYWREGMTTQMAEEILRHGFDLPADQPW